VSSSDILPSSTNNRIAVAVNCFDTEAMSNAVSFVILAPVSTSARPRVPAQTTSPSIPTAAEQPGLSSWTAPSSTPWLCAAISGSTSGVAVDDAALLVCVVGVSASGASPSSPHAPSNSTVAQSASPCLTIAAPRMVNVPYLRDCVGHHMATSRADDTALYQPEPGLSSRSTAAVRIEHRTKSGK
jgi:hypothetical protein